MAHGDVLVSPWVVEFFDFGHREVKITVNFNDSTRALTNAVVHRDTGCKFTKIVLDDPNDGAKAKPLPAPADGAGDRTYTAAQMSAQGLNTIEQVLALQITAV